MAIGVPGSQVPLADELAAGERELFAQGTHELLAAAAGSVLVLVVIGSDLPKGAHRALEAAHFFFGFPQLKQGPQTAVGAGNLGGHGAKLHRGPLPLPGVEQGPGGVVARLEAVLAGRKRLDEPVESGYGLGVILVLEIATAHLKGGALAQSFRGALLVGQNPVEARRGAQVLEPGHLRAVPVDLQLLLGPAAVAAGHLVGGGHLEGQHLLAYLHLHPVRAQQGRAGGLHELLVGGDGSVEVPHHHQLLGLLEAVAQLPR